MTILYGYFHNLSERIKFGKWQLLLFPVLFTIVGIYMAISTGGGEIIPFKNIAVKNAIIPIVFFALGFLTPVSLWRRYVKRFSAGEHLLWNKDGFSFAFLLFVAAVFLQMSAIWLDSSWDKVYVAGLGGYYTEAQLNEIGGYKNEIIMLKRQLSVGGITFQVGEFVKVFFMIFIAKLLVDMRIRGQIKWCREFFAFPLLAILPIVALAILMPNRSMAIIFVLILIFMLLLQKMEFKLRIPLLLAIFVIPATLLFTISTLDKSNPIVKIHGVNRIWAHLNETEAVVGKEQQKEALQAISDGGITGKGLDGGTIKLRLFGAKDDFAYSILGEELGLWLVVPITVAMIGFLFACFWVAEQIKTDSDRNAILAQNIAWGIAIIFSLNVLIHIGVNLDLLPNTGQPLSFVSSGGTNLVMNFFLMGMLVQISSLNKDEAV